MTSDLAGGITGWIVANAIALVVSYLRIRDLKRPKERALMIKLVIASCVGMHVFILLLFLVREPYNFLLFIPLMAAVVLAGRYWSRKRQEFRIK